MNDLGNWLAQRQDLSDSTRIQYSWYLRRFLDWLQSEGLTVDDLDAAGFVRWLDAHEWSRASRRLAVNAMRSFVRSRFGPDHPALKVRLPRVLPAPQRTLTQDETAALLRALEVEDPGDIANAKRVRDLTLMSLLIDTGLRSGEVCRLRLRDVDLEKRTLTAQVKGGRWAQGYFSVITRIRLRYWIALRRDLARPSVEALFVGLGGLTPGCGMTVCGLRSVFRELARELGLNPFSPHALRRTFATLLISNGASSRVTQLAGRWSNIGMVETYTRSLAIETVDPFLPAAVLWTKQRETA